MIKKIRVVKVPEAGYLVIGDRTFSLGDELDISAPFLDPDEVRTLVKRDYIVFVGELPLPGAEEKAH
jgi:hypothetical protein